MCILAMHYYLENDNPIKSKILTENIVHHSTQNTGRDSSPLHQYTLGKEPAMRMYGESCANMLTSAFPKSPL